MPTLTGSGLKSLPFPELGPMVEQLVSQTPVSRLPDVEQNPLRGL
jgi:hypothetical protein